MTHPDQDTLVDVALGSPAPAAVTEHVRSCARCAAEVAELQATVRAVRDGADEAESVAFTAAAHDAAALDRIFFLLEGVGKAQAARTLEAVNAVLAFTGRPAADLDGLSTDRGRRHPLLRGLLARREESLDPNGDSSGPSEGPGPRLSR